MEMGRSSFYSYDRKAQEKSSEKCRLSWKSKNGFQPFKIIDIDPGIAELLKELQEASKGAPKKTQKSQK